MCVSETVWKGRLLRRCERLERPSFVFNALVRQLPALSTPPLRLLFFFSPRSSLPDTFFALTLERDSSYCLLALFYLVAQLVGFGGQGFGLGWKRVHSQHT